MSPEYPCPSCGFFVFEEPSGSYAICPVCGWEDDHVQLRYPGMRGGANGGSLCEWQAETLAELALHPEDHDGFVRDPSWRPLDPSECVVPGDAPGGGTGYFSAALADSPPYYWRPEIPPA